MGGDFFVMVGMQEAHLLRLSSCGFWVDDQAAIAKDRHSLCGSSITLPPRRSMRVASS